MIHCVFSLDYEVYGDGRGSLQELILEPAERLRELFLRRGVRFVCFVEVAELERIEEAGSDPASPHVARQVRDLFTEGFEIGLHLHPQWSNARRADGRWILDYDEYNLCVLPQPRIAEIVGQAIDYLRRLVGVPSFAPLSFRAGNWLFQPTQPAADVLARHGLRIDSSVFKGGVQRGRNLDYRRALKNGRYWRFAADVNRPDPAGAMIEVPVHTEMVPSWRMLTAKRLALSGNVGGAGYRAAGRLSRARDFARLRYPLKLDFCRMTLPEFTGMIDRAVDADRRDPAEVHPVVAIGHTKDPIDVDMLHGVLDHLERRAVTVSTLRDLYPLLAR